MGSEMCIRDRTQPPPRQARNESTHNRRDEASPHNDFPNTRRRRGEGHTEGADLNEVGQFACKATDESRRQPRQYDGGNESDP